jgi:hypothetical protein
MRLSVTISILPTFQALASGTFGAALAHVEEPLRP